MSSGREREASQRFDLARILAIAAAPFLAFGVFAILKWADWGKSRSGKAAETEIAVWQALITAQVVVWAVLAGVGLGALGRLDARVDAWFAEPPDARRARRTRWLIQTLAFLVFAYGLIAALLVLGELTNVRGDDPDVVVTGQDWKVPLLFGLAGMAISPFFVVLKWIQLCAAEELQWSTSARDIERIPELRRQLRTATASLGTVIALFLISSGALSQAFVAAELDPPPDSIVLVAGAWFTAILTAIYLYVFTSVDARARTLLDGAAPLPDPSPAAAEEFTRTMNLRRELSAELELGEDTRKNLEGLIAVLSPLAAALLSRFAGLQ